jgi:hypothetical protein
LGHLVLIAASGWAFWNKPYWGAAEAWAVAILLLPSLVAWVLVRGIRDVVPRKAQEKSQAKVRIYAVNVARAGETDVKVTFEGVEAEEATTTLGDGVALVDAILPDAVPTGPVKIRVTGIDGHGADWTDFNVVQ